MPRAVVWTSLARAGPPRVPIEAFANSRFTVADAAIGALHVVVAFILVGVKVFAVGGTFSTTINSLLPAAGGGAVNENDSANDKEGVLDDEKVSSYVEGIIGTNQENA